MRNPIDAVAELLFDADTHSHQAERIKALEAEVLDLQRQLAEAQIALQAAIEAQQFYYDLVRRMGKR